MKKTTNRFMNTAASFTNAGNFVGAYWYAYYCASIPKRLI